MPSPLPDEPSEEFRRCCERSGMRVPVYGKLLREMSSSGLEVVRRPEAIARWTVPGCQCEGCRP